MIKEFQGNYRWLSNFAPVDIQIDNRIYPSVEHAYMAMKAPDNDEWKNFCANKSNSAGKVKKASRAIKLRHDWNDELRLILMSGLLMIKFTQEPFRSQLISTGNQNIQEGNYWNDKFFGICLKTGEGENHLGRLIMNIRDKINAGEL